MEYTETEYGKIEFGIYDLDKNIILVSFKNNWRIDERRFVIWTH